MNTKHSTLFFLFIFSSTFTYCNSDERNPLNHTGDFNNISHAPSVEDHIKQFRSDMKQIEKQEVEEMVRIVRKKLHTLEEQEELHDIDKTNQVIRSCVVDYISKKIYEEAKLYTKDEQILAGVQELIEMKIITQLEKVTNNFIGHALHQFFGEKRTTMIHTNVWALINASQQAYNDNSHQANHNLNSVPVPPAPPVIQNSSEYYIKQHQTKLAQKLKSSLLTKEIAANDFKRLNNFIADSVTYFTRIKPDDFMAHVRCALTQMLDSNLAQCQRDLFNDHLEQNDLIKSVNKTRDQIIITIEELQSFDKKILFSLLENNLKKEIIENYIGT